MSLICIAQFYVAHFYALVSLRIFQNTGTVLQFFLKVPIAVGVCRSGSTLFQRIGAECATCFILSGKATISERKSI